MQPTTTACTPSPADAHLAAATPPIATVRPNQRAHAFYWSVLTTAVIVSITGNATHAILHARTLPAVAAAVTIIPPIALLAAVHGATILLRTHTPARLPRRLAAAMTLLIAIGAFWLSFTALRELAILAGIPQPQAWLWPIIIEGSMTQATIALIALAGSPERPHANVASNETDSPENTAIAQSPVELEQPTTHRPHTENPATDSSPDVRTPTTTTPPVRTWPQIAAALCARDPNHRRNPAEVTTILTHHHDHGRTPTQIARTTGRSRSTISRIINDANHIQNL